jgi:hypothetical protein
MSVFELGLVTAVMLAIWNHPYITLALALAALVGLILLVRMIWRTLRQVFSGRWVPYRRRAGMSHRPSDDDEMD